MSNIFHYKIDTNKKFTNFVLTPIEIEKIDIPNTTMVSEISRVEGAFDVEYPVRTSFIEGNDLDKVMIKSSGFTKIYTPFERDRVDLSSFISTPHKLSSYAKTTFKVNEAGLYNFRIRTCGAVKIWVNGNLEETYSPYTRNYYSEKSITLPLVDGKNEIVIYLEDLAERDVSFYFELINDNAFFIEGELLLDVPIKEYLEIENLLREAYLAADIFKQGDINIYLGSTLREKERNLRIRVNPRLSLVEDGTQDGNITDFDVDDLSFTIKQKDTQLNIGDVSSIPTAGFTRLELGIQLSSGEWLTRILTCSIYDEEKFSKIINGNTIEERKSEALDYFSKLDLEDINVALVKAHLNKLKDTDVYSDYHSAFRLIEEKGDCADFILAPLLAVYSVYSDRFPENFHKKMEKLATGFRYWIDEPGNDVMWYFSENHALLFHVSQYLSGYLYGDSTFEVSGRSGKEQYEIGKKRLEEWFDYFFKVGFSEWNSTTYFPIDFIGFFSLYLSAPDLSIKKLAEKALNYTFELIALNYHGGTMASTYGRVYEHNLKAMQLGEISSVIEIAWKKGCFNNSLRASALFALTDYTPPKGVEDLLCEDVDRYLKAEYVQGDNQAYTYLYKTKEYSLASTIDYKKFEHGHQQHIMNVSLGDSTILWINNPGEAEYSGGNRPSYWAGNDCLPQVMQYRNILFAHYKLDNTDYQYIHLYLPFWDLDEIIEKENWLFIRKGAAYVAIFFTNPFVRIKHGANADREIQSYGKDQHIMMKVSSKNESRSFQKFVVDISEKTVAFEDGHLIFDDINYGRFDFYEGLERNGEPVLYDKGYDLSYEINIL